MTTFSHCISVHLKDGENGSPIAAYRASMAKDVAYLVSTGKTEQDAWVAVTRSKIESLEAERSRVEAVVSQEYAKTPAGQRATKAPEAAAPVKEQAPEVSKPAEEGKPEKPRVFKSRKNAEKERDRLGNEHRIQPIKGGFILRKATDKEMAAAERNGKRLAGRKSVDTANDSLLMAIAKLGGLSEKHKADTISEGNKQIGGRWLFTKTGTPIDDMALLLDELGYIPADDKGGDGGVRWLQSAVANEYGGHQTYYSQIGGEDRMQARVEAAQGAEPDYLPGGEFDMDSAPLEDFDLEELNAAGYASATPEQQALAEAILAEAEALGLDAETIKEDAARATEGKTDDEYHAEAQRIARAAITSAREPVARSDAEGPGRSGEDRGQVAGDQGAQEGLTDPLTLDKAELVRQINEVVAAGDAPDSIRGLQLLRQRYVDATGKPSIPPVGSRLLPLMPGDPLLAPHSAEDLQAKADREAAAAQAEKDQQAELAARDAKIKRLRDKAEADARKAQVIKDREAAKKAEIDAQVADFELGQEPPKPVERKVNHEQAAGQGSIFDAPAEPVKAEPVSDRIRGRVRTALESLRGIESELADVQRFGGPVELRNRLIKFTDQIDTLQARLTEFRDLAKTKGIDAEAVIKELGGEPDMGRFGTLSFTYVNGDKAVYTGQEMDLHGGHFYAVQMVEGHQKGQEKVVKDAPKAVPAAAPAESEEAPQVTEAQARKQFEWRDFGQKDGVKTHGLFFYITPEDKGTGRAMGRGQVTRYEGSNGWQVDSEGQKYPALADAKAAAIEVAMPVLREQGWIAPEMAAPSSKVEDFGEELPPPMPPVSGIPYDVAQAAHSGTSHVPDQRARQEQEGFKSTLADAWDRAVKVAGNDPAAIARIAELFTDVADGYRTRYLAALGARSRVMSTMIAGGGNFPVRRNEKRNETARKRSDEASEYLGRGIKRLLRAARGPIDNSPESELERVRLNLTQREEAQEQMKAANSALRQGDDEALRDLGFTDEQISELKKPDFAGRKGFPDYRLTNNNSEIRRLRERVKSAEDRRQEAAAGPVEREVKGVRVEEDATADRIRLIFNGKPNEEVRNALKANGFHWSPKSGAWQRQLTGNARAAADAVLKNLPTDDAGNVAMFSRAPATDSAAFRKWFGDSKVVDASDEPLVVYHGTTGDFTQFDLQRGGAVTGAADAREGFFFASNPRAADQFTWKAGDKVGNIMPVYLSMKNPAYSDLVLTGGNGRAAAMQIKNAKAAGHDGIVFRDSDMLDHRGQVFVAFRPEQIKSATGNRGTFDPANPDIRYSRQSGRGLGVHIDDAHAAVAGIREALPKAPPIELFESVHKAPQEIIDLITKAGAEHDIEGLYFKGKIYGFPQHWTSIERGQFVMGHHEIRHAGFDAMFGKDKDRVMLALWTGNQNLRRATQAKMDSGHVDSRIQAVEEALADMPVAEIAKLRGFDRLVAGIRQWLRGVAARLRRAGLTSLADSLAPAQWTDNDIAALVNRAEGMSRAGGGGTAFSRAHDNYTRPDPTGPGMPGAEAMRAKNTPAEIRAAKEALARIEEAGGVTSRDDLHDLLRVTGYSQWAESPLVRDVDAARALRGELQGTIGHLSRQGVITFAASDATDAKIADLTRLADKYDAAIAVRGLVADYASQHDMMTRAGFEPYRGMQERLGRPHSVLFSWIRPAGGISAVTPMFSRAGTIGAAVRNYGAGSKIIGDTGRYTADQIKAMRNVGFQVDTPSLEDRARGLWKDAGKKLVQGLVDQFAPIKDISEKAYALMRLAKGASGAFETVLHGGKLKLTDGVYDFDEAQRGGFVEAVKAMQGEHHDALRWIAANRAEGLLNEWAVTMEDGTKRTVQGQQAAEALAQQNPGAKAKASSREHLFTQADIDAIKTLDNGVTDFDYTIQNGPRAGAVTRDRSLIYRDFNTTLNGFNKNMLDMTEQSGGVTPEARAAFEREFYLPFFRVASEEEGGMIGGNLAGGYVRQNAIKQLKGGKDKLNFDLLDNVLLNWSAMLDAAAKNRGAVETLKAAESMGVAIKAPESTARDMGKSVGKKNNVVWVMEDGHKQFYLVEDKMLLTALSALQFSGMRGPMMDAMGAFKRALTIGVTASPFFKVRNLIRDSLQSVASGPINYNPVANVAQGWKLTARGSDSHFRMLAGGGTIHFGTMTEGSEGKRVQALVESGVPRATILDSENAVKAFYRKSIEPWITAYNELGNRGEEINRASLYDQLRKQGVSHAEASLQARDLMDFSLQGSFTSIRFLTQVVPFFNARLQGLYKLGRAAKSDPARFGAVLGATALASLALLAAYHDDDDWKKREDWDRNNFWWFKIGGTAFRIPKPFEIGAMATLAERGFELAFDKEMTNKRFADNVLQLVSNNLSMNPIPQLVKPMLDVYANTDSFTGRPIESMGMERLQPAYRFTEGTSMTARAASTAANAVTGLVNANGPSPVQIDHMLRGYFGWLGTFLLTAADIIARPATGQVDRPSSDMLKTITGNMASNLDDASSRYVTQMYAQAKEIEQAYGTYRELRRDGKGPEAAEFYSDNARLLSGYHGVERMKAAETKLNQRIHQIEQSDAPALEKRLRIREIQVQKDRIARQLSPA